MLAKRAQGMMDETVLIPAACYYFPM